MKAKTLSAALYHFNDGHHRAINTWYDGDHRPEMHGLLPGVYHSQRYVAPPEYIAARPPTGLPRSGGQYLSLYWGETAPETMQKDILHWGGQLDAQGRNGPLQHMESSWRDRLQVVAAHTRPGLNLSPGAAMIAPHTGVMFMLNEIVDDERREEFSHWHTTVNVPQLAASGLFKAVYKLLPTMHADPRLYAVLYILDAEDPAEPVAKSRDLVDQWAREGRLFRDMQSVRKLVFASTYRWVTPDRYGTYE